MSAVGFAAACALAVIFVWAAGSKLMDRHAVVGDFADMKLPAPTFLFAAVVITEFVTAALLIGRPQVGAAAALVLLGVFSMVLVSIVRSGRQVRCGCFGANHRAPVSVVEIARNAALGVFALMALGASQGASLSLPAVMIVSLVGLMLLVSVSLVALSTTAGSLFRIELAGETAANPGFTGPVSGVDAS